MGLLDQILRDQHPARLKRARADPQQVPRVTLEFGWDPGGLQSGDRKLCLVDESERPSRGPLLVAAVLACIRDGTGYYPATLHLSGVTLARDIGKLVGLDCRELPVGHVAV